MEKVVLITGASSGIGRETALLFQTRNWKVAAAMREPEKADGLRRIADIECFRMDVTDRGSVRSCIGEVVEKFGRIDVVVNNAGYGLFGPFEASSDEQVERQFQTNVFGLMDVCRAVLPHFRGRKKGTIINIASVGGRVGLPFYSVYSSTKWAVEGFTEAVQYEMEPFNIRMKIVEPGPIRTDFYERSRDAAGGEAAAAYQHYTDLAKTKYDEAKAAAPDGRAVAEVIYTAATDGTRKMRYGVNTKGLLGAKRLLPERILAALVRRVLVK